MIRIIDSSEDKLIFKDYPINYWLAFIFLFVLIIILEYCVLFLSPNSATLICTKNFLNTTKCELIETSFFDKNLTHKTITNIQKPRIAFNGRVGKIWLKTEIDLWHGIKNVYYPNSSAFGLRLYNINQQVRLDIEKLNNFIQSWNKNKVLIIQRPIRTAKKQGSFIFKFFWLLLLGSILISPLFIPIIAIFIFPITTYSFDSLKNSLIVKELILFSVKEQSYPLNQLVITSTLENKEEKQPSIFIKLEREKTQIISDFENKAEALKLLNLIKDFIPI